MRILLEASAIAIVVKVLMSKNLVLSEILMFTALVTFTLLILDTFAPGVGRFTRQGAGFAIGYGQVGGDEQVGGGIQAALGLQRTLKGLDHNATPVQTGGMDDPEALEYYKTGNVNGKTNHAIYDSLTSTTLAPALLRLNDDRSLLNRNEVVTVRPHAMEGLIKKDKVKEILPF